MNLLNNSPECNPETMGKIDTVLCGASTFHEATAKRFIDKMKKKICIIEGKFKKNAFQNSQSLIQKVFYLL